MLDREVVLDPARLTEALADGITLFHAGPSLLKALLGHVERAGFDVARFDSVRHASSGGDSVPPAVLRGLCAAFRTAEVFVIYGCSEIACMGCTYPVPRDRPVTRTYVGRAFDNVVARVLDRDGNPVPVGVVGEVWLGGAGVALGYLGQPELTAARFDHRRRTRLRDRRPRPHRRRRQPRARRPQRLPDQGAWHAHRARRGRTSPARCAGRGRRCRGGARYAERRSRRGRVHGAAPPAARGERAAVAAIRRHLTEQLPDYMVPARYVELAALPLNHNLKLDRNALPPPPAPGAGDDVRPAETDTEHALVAAFRRVLALRSAIGVDDNFFELGGDSMHALELVAIVERELGVRLDGLEVLREPLAVLAASCDTRRGRQLAPPRPPGAPPSSVTDAWDAFHFGPGNELYGVLRGDVAERRRNRGAGRRRRPTRTACAPGSCSAQLARRLAARGVPSLAFDLLRLLGLAR